MYGGIRAANTEIMNDMFRRQQADRAQQNAERQMDMHQQQLDQHQQNADREFGYKQEQANVAQQNADRKFQMERDLAQAELDYKDADMAFKEQEQAWKEEEYKRRIQEADLRLSKLQRDEDRERAIAEASKEADGGTLYSAVRDLMEGRGQRVCYGTNPDGSPVYEFTAVDNTTGKKIVIDDAVQVTDKRMEVLKLGECKAFANMRDLFRHKNNESGKWEFLVVNDDISVTPISEDQMYSTLKDFAGQKEVDRMFGRSEQTREMDMFREKQKVINKNKNEQVLLNRWGIESAAYRQQCEKNGTDPEAGLAAIDARYDNMFKKLSTLGEGGNGGDVQPKVIGEGDVVQPGEQYSFVNKKTGQVQTTTNTFKHAITVKNGELAKYEGETGSPSPEKAPNPEVNPKPAAQGGADPAQGTPVITESPAPTEDVTEEDVSGQEPVPTAPEEAVQKKPVPFMGKGMRYADVMGYGQGEGDAGYDRTMAGIRDARSQYDANGTGAMIGARDYNEQMDGRGEYLNRGGGIKRTAEERGLGNSAMTALNAAAFSGGGFVAKLANLGMSAKAAKRIYEGNGTVEDQQVLIGTLIGAGMSAKQAYGTARQYMGSAWREGVKFNGKVKSTGTGAKPVDIGTSRKIPKPTDSSGFNRADSSLAYMKLDRAGVKKLEEGVVGGEWQYPEKIAKGVNSAFDTKADGFKGAIVTVKKDRVGNGKTAPRLEDLDGVWVNKNGKKVNVLPQILEKSRAGKSSAELVGRKYSKQIGAISDALELTGKEAAKFKAEFSAWKASAASKGKSSLEFIGNWMRKAGKHYVGDYASEAASAAGKKAKAGAKAVGEAVSGAAKKTGGLVTSSVGKAVDKTVGAAKAVHDKASKGLDKAFPETRNKHALERIIKDLDEDYAKNFGLEEFLGL